MRLPAGADRLRVALATPWGARVAALLCGLAAGLAHPPFGLLAGLAGFAGLLRLGDAADAARPLRSAFLRGWLAGLGYFAVSVWWVVEAFLVDAAVHGWMAPFALVFMAGGLALFWGAALALYRLTGAAGGWRVLVFAGAFALLEFARGHVLTGFPWNLPGEAWRAGGPASQAAALVGAYGLTWITLALGAAPALAFDPVPRRARLVRLAPAIAALALLYGFGVWRLSQPEAAAGGTVVRIVQADVDQKEKWRPENLEAIFADYVRLTTAPAEGRSPDVVIWPEGALPAVIDDLLAPDRDYGSRLTRAVAPGQSLVLGANRAGLGEDGTYDYFNSLISFRRTGADLVVTGVYDKHRLVPFGEFLPLGDLATRLGIRSLVHMPEDFSFGPPPQPLAPAGLPPVQPLICYEALFPRMTSAAAERRGFRPAWLLNISNDAWFGATSGPLQHLNLASYRAIEEGLPMVRATPTGVSAMIDARGRTLAQLGLGEAGVLDHALPPPRPATAYARFGETGLAALLGVSALALVASRARRRRDQPGV